MRYFKVCLYASFLVGVGYWLYVARSYYGWLGFSPLTKYGVTVERVFGAAASSIFPYLEISARHNGETFKCPFPIGGMSDPIVRYHDLDGDGIEEIDFGNSTERQIVSFKPGQGEIPPKFLLLRDDVNGWNLEGKPSDKARPLR
jgi:hypothetical protein